MLGCDKDGDSGVGFSADVEMFGIQGNRGGAMATGQGDSHSNFPLLGS